MGLIKEFLLSELRLQEVIVDEENGRHEQMLRQEASLSLDRIFIRATRSLAIFEARASVLDTGSGCARNLRRDTSCP